MNSTTEEISRGICPEGGHIPSMAEWTELADFLVQEHFLTPGEIKNSTIKDYWADPAGPLKSASSSEWDVLAGTDIYGFNILSSGYRNYNGTFDTHNYFAQFWTSSENTESTSNGWGLTIRNNDHSMVFHNNDNKSPNGKSVRCVRD